MTTSGTSTFTYNRDQIIRAAGRKIGAWAAGETPSATELQDWSDALNIMVKHWNATGIHLWTTTEATLWTVAGQKVYQLGSGSSDHFTYNEPSNTWANTSLTANANVSATSITVDDASGIANADTIGVVLDDGTIQWTTVNGTPAGNVVTLAAALTDSSTSGNGVFAYTSQIVRPLRVVRASRLDLLSNIEIPMMPMLARVDYFNLPNKDTGGVPTQCFYDPQLTYGNFYIWPVPTDYTSAINFTWYRPIEDFNVAGDNADLPVEWISALVFNLAVEMAHEYDVPPQRMAMVSAAAQAKLDTLMVWDREPESVMFGVDFSQVGR